jgi:hypothetical protein
MTHHSLLLSQFEQLNHPLSVHFHSNAIFNQFQIVPKEVKDRNEADTDADSRCSESDRRPSSDDGAMLSAATMQQPNRQTRRELPRIVTNGTLNRAGAAGKRRLPERSLPPAPEPVHAYPPGVRLFRSNLPRPAPMVHHHQQFAQSRVPLPPVPELDRSDHERESISPIPEQRNLRPIPPKPKALPSPLVTPIQPAERHLPKPRRMTSRSAELPPIPTAAAQNRNFPERNFFGRSTSGPTLHQVLNRINRRFLILLNTAMKPKLSVENFDPFLRL